MAKLRPLALNGVNANGTAMVTVNGTRIDVTMAASGLLPDNPQAPRGTGAVASSRTERGLDLGRRFGRVRKPGCARPDPYWEHGAGVDD